MISPWKAYKQWEEKRLVRYDPARWEKVRARGEKHFIWRGVLLFGGTQTLVLTLLDLFRHRFDWMSLIIRLVVFGLFGRWSAIRLWTDAEARYRDYRLHHPRASSSTDESAQSS